MLCNNVTLKFVLYFHFQNIIIIISFKIIPNTTLYNDPLHAKQLLLNEFHAYVPAVFLKQFFDVNVFISVASEQSLLI